MEGRSKTKGERQGTSDQMTYLGGFPVPISPSIRMPHGKVINNRLGNSSLVEKSIRIGRKQLGHSSGSMVLPVVEKLSYRKFVPPTGACLSTTLMQQNSSSTILQNLTDYCNVNHNVEPSHSLAYCFLFFYG